MTDPITSPATVATAPSPMGAVPRSQRCGIAASIDVIGDRWALLIVREVFFGHHRFSEIARVTGAPTDRLAARLKALVDAGVLERREYQQTPPRADYHLTEAGADLVPVLLSLLEWGNRWGGPSVEPIGLHHDHELRVHPVCDTCGADVHNEDVTRKPGLFDWDRPISGA
jgi:DNA-binding HxlR family transcriptional regulator